MEHETAEIDLKSLIYMILKGYKIIIGFVCAALILSFAYSSISYEPVYVINASMVVNSKQVKVLGGEVTLTNDIYLSQKMVNTYKVILLSDNVLQKVNLELNSDIEPSLMRKWISVSSPKDTEVIMVSVKNSDSELAADIANAIMKVAPGVIAETVEVGSINVIDYAKVPNLPQPAKRGMNLAIGIILGLMIGVFVVFAMNFFTQKIRNGKDVVEILALNILGDITHTKTLERARKKKVKKRPLISDENIEGHFIESFKLLALNVMHIIEEEPIKKLMVTSSDEKEGKTTVSINLAMSMAKMGKAVLLMECDLYKRSLFRERLGPDAKCLSEVLEGTYSYEEALLNDVETGLDILPSWKNTDHSSELLGSHTMENLLGVVEEKYDLIIMDTPPGFGLSDAIYLSKYSDGVVIVVRQEQAQVDNIIELRDSFVKLDVPIIGCVLNDIRYAYADKKYKDRYKYNYDGYYSDPGEVNADLKKIKRKKRILGLMVVFWIAVVGFFATRTGEEIIQMSEEVVNFVIYHFEKFGIIKNDRALMDAKSAGLSLYGTEIEYWSVAMHHWIHSILFFSMTLISMAFLTIYEVKPIIKVGVTIVVCFLFSLGNEFYQSFFVEGRGYEFIDIFYALIGLVFGFLVYRTVSLVRKKN